MGSGFTAHSGVMANQQALKPVLPPNERLKRLEKAGTEVRVCRSVPIQRYFRSGGEMLRMANNYSDDQSPEKAYILYHKYLSLFIEKIKTHPLYSTIDGQEKSKVMKNLRVVMGKCEGLKVVLKLSYREDYDEYLAKVEVLRLEEEERQKREDELRIQEENLRLQEETEKYHKEKERNVAVARDRELAIWQQVLHDQERAMEEEKKRRDGIVPSAPVPSFDRSEKPLSKPDVPDRSTKPFSFMHDHEIGGEGPSCLKTLVVPSCLMPMFLSVAEPNTTVNVETCGILAGKLSRNQFRITHLIVPKQSGSSDSCTTAGEEELIAWQDKLDLITLGWIHTHPSQTAFLSSVDLHTHCSYQLMLPEAVAIVCSPKFDETGFFVLTPNHGLDYISNCHETGFHPHPKEPPLFEEGGHIEIDNNSNVKVIDLR